MLGKTVTFLTHCSARYGSGHLIRSLRFSSWLEKLGFKIEFILLDSEINSEKLNVFVNHYLSTKLKLAFKNSRDLSLSNHTYLVIDIPFNNNHLLKEILKALFDTSGELRHLVWLDPPKSKEFLTQLYLLSIPKIILISSLLEALPAVKRYNLPDKQILHFKGWRYIIPAPEIFKLKPVNPRKEKILTTFGLIPDNKMPLQNLKIISNSPNIISEIANSSIVITSFGLTMFEALKLGKRVCIVPKTEEQIKWYSHLFKLLGITDKIPKEIKFLSQNFTNVFFSDKRIETAFEGIWELLYLFLPVKDKDLTLELTTEDDMELLLYWRQNPKIYKFFKRQKKPLSWEEHEKWWHLRKDRIDWIINYKGRRVGTLNVSNFKKTPEIGIFIGDISIRSKGLGTRSIKLALHFLRNAAYKTVRAVIHKENIPSQRAFEKAGFEKEGNLPENPKFNLFIATLD